MVPYMRNFVGLLWSAPQKAFPIVGESYWVPYKGQQLAQDYSFLIVASSILYIPIVLLLQQWMKARPPFNFRKFSIAWDLTLSLLSVIGSVIVIVYDAPILLQKFAPDASIKPYTRAVLGLFTLTKGLEFGDTIILVLKKKPVIFLHLWHHFTVTLYCWHAQYVDVPFAHHFAFINLNIHFIMYLYFAASGLFPKHPLIRSTRPYITLAQTLQMFVGMYLSQMAIRSEVGTPDQRLNAQCALAIYTSYAYLFAKLYLDNYCKHLRAGMVLLVATVFLASGYGVVLLGYRAYYGGDFEWVRLLAEVGGLSCITALLYSRNDGGWKFNGWGRGATTLCSFLVQWGSEAELNIPSTASTLSQLSNNASLGTPATVVEAHDRSSAITNTTRRVTQSSRCEVEGSRNKLESKQISLTSEHSPLQRDCSLVASSGSLMAGRPFPRTTGKIEHLDELQVKNAWISTNLCRNLLIRKPAPPCAVVAMASVSKELSLFVASVSLPLLYGWVAYGDVLLGLCVHGGFRWALELFAVQGIAHWMAPIAKCTQFATSRAVLSF